MNLSGSVVYSKIMKIRLWLTFCCLVQAAGSVVAQTGQIKENVAYGPLPAEKLDLCGADDPSHKKPGVLLIHGGAWSGGDKEDYKGVCARLVQKGFVAAEVNYRLGDKAEAETWWPAQLSDVQLAVRYLRAHADTIGLDPTRLCAWGASAGGHLSVFLGVKDSIVPDVLAKLFPDQSPKVSCVVDDFGPVDLSDPTFSNLRLGMFAGKGPGGDPEGYRDASPIFLVSKTSAPMIIAQGYADRLVPFSQSQRLFEALTAQKVPVQFRANSGGHGEAGLLSAQMDAITEAEIAFIAEQMR
jgi:acetyl esterase/lipase